MTRGKAAVRAAFVAAAALIATTAIAQTTGSARTRDYVEAAAGSDAFEMLAADTALAQSTDPTVRRFAQRMLADHTRLSDALRQAAASAGLKPPSPGAVGADQAPLLAALQGVKGPDFDRAFWQQQRLAHAAALTTTQGYAASGDDPRIRRTAAAAITVITAHQAMLNTAPASP